MNMNDLVGLMGGALLLGRRRGGSCSSGIIVVVALGRFDGDTHGSRGVPLTSRGDGSIFKKG
jgi:hypothetical protein